MADEGLDYDDLISQNILIRREEKEDKTATVEVLTKQSDDYENLYQKQAEIYHMDVDLHGYLKTSLGEEGSEEGNIKSEDSSDYEVVVKPVKRDLSPDYEEQDTSSDSDWGVARKPKTQKGVHHCDECNKKCATKHGLLMHKRSHERQKLKMKKEETPPHSPPMTPEHLQQYVKVEIGVKEEEPEEEQRSVSNDGDEEEEEEEDDDEEEEGSQSPVGNSEAQQEEDDEDDEEEETDLNG